jgi:Fe-S cluster assembly protein SufD
MNAYASSFSQIADGLPGRGLDWVDCLRRAGLERFVDLGFPTTRIEEWKYTNVAPISRIAFQPATHVGMEKLSAKVREQVDLFPTPKLVFVNGRSHPSLSKQGSLSFPYIAGMFDSLGDPDFVPTLQPHLGRYADFRTRPFAAWNTAFFADGACVVVPAGTIVSEPIHLVFISTASDQPCATFPRNLIIAGEGSQISLVETYLSLSGGIYLTNTVTEIVAGAGAVIDYYKAERESSESFHIASVNAALGHDAVLTAHSFSIGAALSRNELRVTLDGEGAQCALDGLFLADGHRLVDNHTQIDHRKPHATSRELYKGVLAGYGEGVFNGAIIVRDDAQKTDAVQHNRNLILSEHAQINTQPQLEIRADDVRCAHGASIGQLDQEALFYLKTRGVDDRSARRILVRGFAAEILDGVRVPDVRWRLGGLLDEWFESKAEAS